MARYFLHPWQLAANERTRNNFGLSEKVLPFRKNRFDSNSQDRNRLEIQDQPSHGVPNDMYVLHGPMFHRHFKKVLNAAKAHSDPYDGSETAGLVTEVPERW